MQEKSNKVVLELLSCAPPLAYQGSKIRNPYYCIFMIAMRSLLMTKYRAFHKIILRLN